MAGRRSTIWADVVGNLAVLTVLTIALNAVLLWRVEAGLEGASRARMAVDLSQSIALRLEVVAATVGGPDTAVDAYRQVLQGALLSDAARALVVVTNTGLQPVASRGEWPVEALDEAGRLQWLLDAADLREAVGAKRTVRGEWTGDRALGTGGWSTASTPIRGPNRAVVGAVRVAIPPRGSIPGVLAGPALPILLGFTLVSAVGMGLFGFALFRRRILAPIEALEEGTEALAAGDFQARLPPGPSNELGAVADRFNALAEALERYREEAENRVDELQAMNADLRQARADLVFAEKMATVGRLAAGVAHELGNPLASVIGFAELLEYDTDGSLAPDLLPRMRSELDRIHRIVGELLAYSRREEVSVDQLEPVPVGSMLRTVADLVRIQPRFSRVEIVVDLPDELPSALGVADKLQQILLNLMVNAAEAMGGDGRIVASARVDREGVILSVRDHGRGVSPELEDSLFEPFFTTKDVGEGTGLGLSVSQQLAESMGGSIRLAPVTGTGARFELRLPRGPAFADIETVRLRGVRRSAGPAEGGS